MSTEADETEAEEGFIGLCEEGVTAELTQFHFESSPDFASQPETPTPLKNARTSPCTNDISRRNSTMVLSQEDIDGCRQAFLAFDKDRSGTIDVWELRQVLEAMGQAPTEDELFQMISEGESRTTFVLGHRFVFILHTHNYFLESTRLRTP